MIGRSHYDPSVYPEGGAPRKQSLAQVLHLDLPLVTGLLLLCGLGLFVLYSAFGADMVQVQKQGLRLLLALGIMLALAQVSPLQWQRWAPWLFLSILALLVAVLAIGHVGKGAQRWLNLGLFRFQPSELMKLALPMAMAWYLARRSLPPRPADLILGLVAIAVPAFLIAKQPDLGTAILVASAGAFVLFFAGMSWRIIGGLIGLIAAAAPLAWMFMHEYQKKRVRVLLDPLSDPLGSGYHIIQSKIAIGSGGISGKGWLEGTQSHLEFLPEHHTDFIFAVLAEELGLVGIIFLLALYLFVLYRGLYLAASAQDSFSRLLGGSIVLVFFVYIFVNIGMVSGLLPVVGVPLPLLSYGGTSLITILGGFGVLMSLQGRKKFMPS
jgi:rod shape determining protein RodA